jgi:hypothetical protein
MLRVSAVNELTDLSAMAELMVPGAGCSLMSAPGRVGSSRSWMDAVMTLPIGVDLAMGAGGSRMLVEPRQE